MIEFNGYIGGDNLQQYVPYYHGDKRPKNCPMINKKYKNIPREVDKKTQEMNKHIQQILKEVATLPRVIRENTSLTLKDKRAYYMALKMYKKHEPMNYIVLGRYMQKSVPIVTKHILMLESWCYVEINRHGKTHTFKPLILE